MLIQIFKSILLMSAAGGVLSVFLLCVKPITRKLFSPKWQYYIWLTVLIVMALPVSFSLPEHTPHIPDRMTEQVQHVPVEFEMPADNQNAIAGMPAQSEKFPVPKINLPQTVWGYLSVLWLFAAVVIMLARITKYYLFLGTMRKHSRKDTSLADIPKRLAVRRTDMLGAPLMIGLIKPVLYLPDTELQDGNLEYIFMHELTHYKRHDLLYKWAALIIKSVHWFNPFVYLVSKQIDLDCEVSCDFAVTGNLSRDEKNDYMNMILGLLANSKSNLRPLTTQMASSKKTLKRRFEMIRNKKNTSKFVSALSAVIAAAMLGTTVFASGMLAGLNESNYTSVITNYGEKIELVNKPFVENHMIYLPLRELLEQIGAMNTTGNKIEWNNGKISIDIENIFFEIEIGSDTMQINNKGDMGEYISIAADACSVPVLKDDITYVPFDYIDYILCQFGEQYKVICNIWDKRNGSDVGREADYSNVQGLVYHHNHYYAENEQRADETDNIHSFFRAFSAKDFPAMTSYCTEKCRNTFFDDGYCFGMTWAELTDISIDPLEYAKSSNDFNVFVTVNMTPHENSVFDKSQTSTSFYVILERQPDGRYLIDEFATGL